MMTVSPKKNEKGASMSKTYKILGKRGRITIPYEIRTRLGFTYNDVVSFEDKGNGYVVIKKEKICDSCNQPAEADMSILEYLDSLTPIEQNAALAYLSRKRVDTRARQIK